MDDTQIIMQNLHEQADAIDEIMRSFGLLGRVEGGKREGFVTVYIWQLREFLTAQVASRLGHINPADLDAELVQRFGQGATWQPAGNRIAVTVPLSPEATIAGMRMRGITIPPSL